MAFEQFVAAGNDGARAAAAFAQGMAAILRDPAYRSSVWPPLESAYATEGGLAAFVTAMLERMGAPSASDAGVIGAIVEMLGREEANLRSLVGAAPRTVA